MHFNLVYGENEYCKSNLASNLDYKIKSIMKSKLGYNLTVNWQLPSFSRF